MSYPKVVSQEEWLAARKELLTEEKAMTRARDALNVKRRELPMVKIEKEYVFDGPEGEVRLVDMFDGRRQLIVQHFMFDPEWEDGCSSCTAGADEISAGLLRHLHARDTTLAVISRAPLAKIERYKAKRGWSFPWYSSYGSDFNYGLPRDDRRVGRARAVELPHDRRARRARLRMDAGRIVGATRPQRVPA